ncbi:MAG: DUF4743 domain-containing protein [Proteobacteria bacterium]|nr:DUF4743 domain-containing protein [Pseudomonadota bacterium]
MPDAVALDDTIAAVRARLARAQQDAPSDWITLRIGDEVAGRMSPPRALRLAAFADVFTLDDALRFVPALADEPARTAALARVARTLAAEGALTRWRDERYAAAPALGAPPWFLLERAAARYFGLRTHAVHANGLVATRDGWRMWIARRSLAKPIDPGMLDNLVGGGMAAGEMPAAALVREAWEEAGIPAALVTPHTRTPAATLAFREVAGNGYVDETVFAYDLWLPAGFVPRNQDGEVVEHRLVDRAEALRLMALADDPDAMTPDAALVALDCLERNAPQPAA